MCLHLRLAISSLRTVLIVDWLSSLKSICMVTASFVSLLAIRFCSLWSGIAALAH